MSDEPIIMQPNKYGYRVNITHPLIRPMYERFKKEHKIMIPSDEERLFFESKIIDYINKKRDEKQ